MTKRFVVSCAAGFLLFVLINILATHLASDCGLPVVFGQDACADDIVRAGWPLQFYEEGGFAYRSHFSFGMLAIDLGIALLIGLAIGMIFSRRLK